MVIFRSKCVVLPIPLFSEKNMYGRTVHPYRDSLALEFLTLTCVGSPHAAELYVSSRNSKSNVISKFGSLRSTFSGKSMHLSNTSSATSATQHSLTVRNMLTGELLCSSSLTTALRTWHFADELPQRRACFLEVIPAWSSVPQRCLPLVRLYDHHGNLATVEQSNAYAFQATSH